MGFTTSYCQKERWSRRAADTLTSCEHCWNPSLGNWDVHATCERVIGRVKITNQGSPACWSIDASSLVSLQLIQSQLLFIRSRSRETKNRDRRKVRLSSLS